MRTLIILVLLLAAACSEPEEQTTERASATRTLEYTASVAFMSNSDTEISTIEAAVADDDHTRSEGLMDIHDLPSDAGMLFIFDDEEPRSFWMANTPIPLDIIFVNADFEIVRIHRNASPYSHESFRSEHPAKYVVEVNAGYTMRHDINEGMRIRINL